jgi:hypothetical protein
MMRKKKTRKQISVSIKRYYDSLTDEQVAEDRAWGEFAAGQFAREDCSDEWQGESVNVNGEGPKEIQRLVIARQLLKD